MNDVEAPYATMREKLNIAIEAVGAHTAEISKAGAVIQDVIPELQSLQSSMLWLKRLTD